MSKKLSPTLAAPLRLAFAATLLAALPGPPVGTFAASTAPPVFFDHFAGATINQGAWNIRKPFNDSNVFAENANAVLMNRGIRPGTNNNPKTNEISLEQER